MKVFKQISEISEFLNELRNEKKDINIGFVPTMGALHEGHMSLINEAKHGNQIAVCSIYVNPLQFNNKMDYEKYPRNYETDLNLLKINNCDIVFMPSEEEMKPEGDYPEYDMIGLDKVMEGRFRPGHFRGVVYIVKKLFEIVKPDNAYFGMKDFQQFAIIKSQIEYHPNIIGCPIIRDKDGLALSSRNMRLSQEQRKIAPEIFKTLLKVKELFNGSKNLNTNEIYEFVKQEIEKNQLMKLEYFEIVDTQSLLPIKENQSINVIACIAVYLGDVRLIDNIILF